MRRSFLLFFMGMVFFLFFVAFSYLVHKDLFTQFDFNTTVKLQDNLPARVDEVFSFFSTVGNFEVLLLVLVGILFVSRKVVASLVTFGAFGFFHVIELISKTFIHHPPPPQFMLRTDHPFDLPQFHIRSEYSYPSGHSGRTVFLSVLILFFLWRSKRVPKMTKLVVSALVGGVNAVMLLSRVYLGEHWLTDVVGGVLLALSLSMISLSFYTLPKSIKLW